MSFSPEKLPWLLQHSSSPLAASLPFPLMFTMDCLIQTVSCFIYVLSLKSPMNFWRRKNSVWAPCLETSPTTLGAHFSHFTLFYANKLCFTHKKKEKERKNFVTDIKSTNHLKEGLSWKSSPSVLSFVDKQAPSSSRDKWPKPVTASSYWLLSLFQKAYTHSMSKTLRVSEGFLVYLEHIEQAY
jgi:hypothetical protein